MTLVRFMMFGPWAFSAGLPAIQNRSVKYLLRALRSLVAEVG